MRFSPGPALEAALERSRPVHAVFAHAGHRLHLVGGIVRDDLAGRSRDDADHDLTTDAPPEVTKSLVAPMAEAVWTQGERFGTIGARVAGHDLEITTYRAESYEASSRKPAVAFGTRIEEDLARRDFTVNAMAVDCGDGTLVDPFDGRADLAAGVLRTPLDPSVSFTDDPLRMLRAARFVAGFGFAPDPSLVEAVRDMAGRMGIVSVERVREELSKTLLLPDPAPGFEFLTVTGLLPHVLPALAASPGDPVRAATRAGRTAPVGAARWAALLLDLEPAVRAGELSRLRPSGALSAAVVWLGSAATWLDRPFPADEPSLRRAAAATPSQARLEDLLDFLAAVREPDDHAEDLAVADRALRALRGAEPDLDEPELPLDGLAIAAVLGVEPGPAVGRAVARLREERFARGPFDAETAVAVLRSAE